MLEQHFLFSFQKLFPIKHFPSIDHKPTTAIFDNCCFIWRANSAWVTNVPWMYRGPCVSHFLKFTHCQTLSQRFEVCSYWGNWYSHIRVKPRPQNRIMVPLRDSFTIFDKHPSLLCWYESPPQDAAAKAPPVRKQFLVFTGHVINTKNCNHSINWVKNLAYNRWSKYKQPHQVLDLCCF